MNPVCKLFAHRVISPSPANQGFHFSRCCRCHTDLMRSARQDFSNWRAVPDGLRINWRGFDPDEAMPLWYVVTCVRAAFANIAAGVSAAFALCFVAARVLLEGCRAAPARIGRALSHSAQSADCERRCRKRFSVVVFLQRDMVHFECKVARP